MTNKQILEQIRPIILEKLGVDASEITPNAFFEGDLGADSLDKVELLMIVERDLEVIIPDSEQDKIQTVNDVIKLVKKCKVPKAKDSETINKKLLHIVDMQNDFVMANGKLSVAGAESLIEPANEFLRNVKFDKIIATFDTHYRATYNNTSEARDFPPHCLYGTNGWKLAIKLDKYDRVLKNVYDVWADSRAIEKTLTGFEPKNTDVYIMGVASDFCVKYAVLGYIHRGYSVTIIKDLCCGINTQIETVFKNYKNAISMTTSKQLQNQM